ncbi:caspase family protein [Mucilaginibacter psychrotolerans]|uniref:Caspase family protein n=1 Tax=Mucilaginibacter psychrotolerans TaxID=1524096 RepID=A0A4Y8S4S2_9SPHI|nr:caspase family protein [Mucilaginibacter psychrotolerans]TFF33635.1 caspase family protein [Mucilaginibacter psychrotolerans]
MIKLEPKHTYAAIIGISKFDHMPDVPHCEKSAEKFHELLLDNRYIGLPEHNIRRLNSADGESLRDNMVKFIYSVSSRINNPHTYQLDRIDNLIFFYSGHGEKDKDENLVLFARNTSMETLSDLGIPFKRLLEHLLQTNLKRIIFIIDSCYSGAAQGGNDTINLDIRPDYCVIRSARKHQQSYFSDHPKYTDFTAVFFNMIEQGIRQPLNRFINIGDIGQYLRANFRKSERQNPDVRSDGELLEFPLFKNVLFRLSVAEEKIGSDDPEIRLEGMHLLKELISSYTKHELQVHALKITALTEKIVSSVFDEPGGAF